jgi:hypothetical protein
MIAGLVGGFSFAVSILQRFPTLRKFLFGEEVDLHQVTIPEQPWCWRAFFIPVMTILAFSCKIIVQLTPNWVAAKLFQYCAMDFIIKQAAGWIWRTNFWKPVKDFLWKVLTHIACTVLFIWIAEWYFATVFEYLFDKVPQ